MDKNTLVRWAIIALLVGAFMKWGPNLFGSKHDEGAALAPSETYVDAPGFKDDSFATPDQASAGKICKIHETKGGRFEAELSSIGAAITHFKLLDPQYAGLDVSTTPDHERWRSLRTLFRGEGGEDQIAYDRFAWNLDDSVANRCVFTYQDASVSITKTVALGERPFELDVTTTVTNRAAEPKKHRFSIASYAFRTNGETKGHLGRMSPFVTDLQCARADEVTRKQKDDFKEGWFSEPLVDRYAAVSNYYFAQAMVPSAGYDGEKTGVESAKPECALRAEPVRAPGKDADDDNSGAIYHAVLKYPAVSLAPGGKATYEQIAYFGPKERDVLAKSAGGKPRLGDLINLGKFSIVSRALVAILVFFHGIVGNWGLAVICLTLCLRIGLFPLSLKQIHTTIAMRRIKPEIDELSKKFPDDAQARQMAMMELYRKHGINPLGGCLPQLVQLPIWWAMWATLQTAVEMYHERFLWLSDLSAPDKFFILPVVYGVFIVLQQRIVPQQGMDPMQQKMMTWVMPIMFTGFVLFTPAALGLYMLTSSALGIAQQLVVEKIAPRNPPGSAGSAKKGEIVVKQVNDAAPKAPAFGKGKARV
jgi:YidC/Oxa1 family membrane protein insertase